LDMSYTPKTAGESLANLIKLNDSINYKACQLAWLKEHLLVVI